MLWRYRLCHGAADGSHHIYGWILPGQGQLVAEYQMPVKNGPGRFTNGVVVPFIEHRVTGTQRA